MMDKNHFVLRKRYRAIMKDGSKININLCPENCWYFREQEGSYLIRAIRRQDNLDINQVESIETYFIPLETKEEIEIRIGV